VIGTDRDPRALACARDNIDRLGLGKQVKVVEADLFPEGRAPLIVCNPPWLPGKVAAPIEGAVYDPDSRMLRGFLAGLKDHLTPDGEGWLILSDFAEHLGLRQRGEVLRLIEAAGLKLIQRHDTRPTHKKATDQSDPLYLARVAEKTSLWRLAAA
jgi:methylase of polypeptide subunit release factors